MPDGATRLRQYNAITGNLVLDALHKRLEAHHARLIAEIESRPGGRERLEAYRRGTLGSQTADAESHPSQRHTSINVGGY
jgi:hypothetical protein